MSNRPANTALALAAACFLLILPGRLAGQDPHFSQLLMAPVYQNPAQAGLFEGSYRLGLNYRSQWNAVTTPYSTLLASFDMPLIRKRLGKAFAGTGFFLLRDKAGDAGYGTFQASLPAAWHFPLSKKKPHYLSLGFQVSFGENSLDLGKLRFPDQYDGNQYIPALPSGETPGKEKRDYLDLAAGATWWRTDRKNRIYTLGISAFHLNTPDHSLLRDKVYRLRTRWSLQGTMTLNLNPEWDLTPVVIANRQGTQQEVVAGISARYNRWAEPSRPVSLTGGIYNRGLDALILHAGIEYAYVSAAISYDVNYSGLRKASYLRGGPEFSVQYVFNKPRGKLNREPTCPIF